MEIKQVRGVYWSPTGATRAAAEELTEALSKALNCPCQLHDITLPHQRETILDFGPEDLALACCPTFAGKMPNKMLPFFRSILKGNGAPAVAVVTFGNRSFDNSLAELCSVLEEDGFHTLAGAALVCRHSFSHMVASDRPNEVDHAQRADFAARVAEKVRNLTSIPAPIVVDGDAAAPYYTPRGLDGQPVNILKVKPTTDEALCAKCGLCAASCPPGSIDKTDFSLIPGPCIKCQACIRLCPTGAKKFTDPTFLSHLAMLETNFAQPPKENSFFL